VGYYDPVRRTWVDPVSKQHTSVQLNNFTNPSKGITYDPTTKEKETDLLLKDIFPGYLQKVGESNETARILKSIEDVLIPHDTSPATMASVAIRKKYGETVTLRQIYFGFVALTAHPQTSGAQKLKEVGDVPIPYDTPLGGMVMTAVARKK
jgi:hypothetical protein